MYAHGNMKHLVLMDSYSLYVDRGHLSICDFFEWLVTKRPYLVEDTSVTPDVTGCGVLAVVQSLRSRPLHWNLPSMRNVEALLLKIPRQSKVCNLNMIKSEDNLVT